ncbi:hypothetical protein [Undibacterium pigrum]|uniref:hypothetical protein n=1 Tax=Undibacterium pigrum TaxID=401470 RepID=UPI001B85B941|nr:hypothetical protein [Undibacterium pigrum]
MSTALFAASAKLYTAFHEGIGRHQSMSASIMYSQVLLRASDRLVLHQQKKLHGSTLPNICLLRLVFMMRYFQPGNFATGIEYV